jgi:mono/diheme cytochrome c family protein
MTPRARLTLALLGIAFLAGTALALGLGRPPRSPNQGVEAIRQEVLEETTAPGKRLFSVHKCVVCHGADGSGTEMGPGLGAIIPEYLSVSGGSEEIARTRLVEYLKDPKGRPKLRRDSTLYINPMPGAKSLGLTDEQVAQIAEYILHLRPPAQAVGGDAQGR